VWRVLRRQARLTWWLERLEHDERTPRARALADLALESQGGKAFAIDRELFQGPHAAVAPDAIEWRLLERMAEATLFHRDMPSWVRSEYPVWLEERLERLFGPDLVAEMGAMRDEAPVDLRVNTLKTDRDGALAALAACGLRATPTPLSPLGLRLPERVAMLSLPPYRDGLVEVQDEGSQLVALLTDAQPGMAVVDYCAGAGGKTLALAASMDNRGRLIACDVAEWRVDRAQERLRRAGAHNVTRRVIGAEGDKWIKRNAGGFDRVLVDAPCSGTGTWRRNPDAKWHLSARDLEELALRQADILASAARLVRPGGRLIYATCSLLPEENEDQIDRFLAAHPTFAPQDIAPLWGERIGTPCPVPGPWLRLSPLRHGTDGFFAAVLTRAEAGTGQGHTLS